MLAVPVPDSGRFPSRRRNIPSNDLLVEGPPDMISARSKGLPAIAVSGDDVWNPDWAQMFTARIITVALDSDAAGRAASVRIPSDVNHVGAAVSDFDLAPERADGYDLADWHVVNTLNAQDFVTATRTCTRTRPLAI
jgi:DNA primase